MPNNTTDDSLRVLSSFSCSLQQTQALLRVLALLNGHHRGPTSAVGTFYFYNNETLQIKSASEDKCLTSEATLPAAHFKNWNNKDVFAADTAAMHHQQQQLLLLQQRDHDGEEEDNAEGGGRLFADRAAQNRQQMNNTARRPTFTSSISDVYEAILFTIAGGALPAAMQAAPTSYFQMMQGAGVGGGGAGAGAGAAQNNQGLPTLSFSPLSAQGNVEALLGSKHVACAFGTNSSGADAGGGAARLDLRFDDWRTINTVKLRAGFVREGLHDISAMGCEQVVVMFPPSTTTTATTTAPQQQQQQQQQPMMMMHNDVGGGGGERNNSNAESSSVMMVQQQQQQGMRGGAGGGGDHRTVLEFQGKKSQYGEVSIEFHQSGGNDATVLSAEVTDPSCSATYNTCHISTAFGLEAKGLAHGGALGGSGGGIAYPAAPPPVAAPQFEGAGLFGVNNNNNAAPPMTAAAGVAGGDSETVIVQINNKRQLRVTHENAAGINVVFVILPIVENF